MSEHRRSTQLTDEQFRVLFDAFPDDPELIAEACRSALTRIHVPNPTGRTQSGVRVYRDNGWNGSGYELVHWDDAKTVGWCLDNGYPQPSGAFPKYELPLVWDDQPERERLLGVQRTLSEWAYR